MKINEIRKNAIWIAEGILGYENCADEEKQKAWQHLIDTRLAYQLQGWFGRTAQNLIEQSIWKERKIIICLINH